MLLGASEADFSYALVGRPAVGLWEERYEVRRNELPIYSKVLDIRATRQVARMFGILLKQHGHSVPSFTAVCRNDPLALGQTCVMQVELSGVGSTTVEVIEKLPALDSEDSPPRGLVMEVSGIRVLDPISLLICKAAAWNDRKDKPGYNDETHIGMLEDIVPAFAKEARERKLDLSERINALKVVAKTFPIPVHADFWAGLA